MQNRPPKTMKCEKVLGKFAASLEHAQFQFANGLHQIRMQWQNYTENHIVLVLI